jgi:N-formylglutamate amidohydrolase
MGALYTVGHDPRSIRPHISDGRREELLAIYDDHHQALKEVVEKRLRPHGEALIIDAHSFPKGRLPYEDDDGGRRPEICLGTDPFHTPNALTEQLNEAFVKRGQF